MDRIKIVNTFEGGLVADLREDNTPKNSVKDALNMELITVADNQYIYQNIKGNELMDSLPYYNYNGIDYKYIPLATKIFNDIAYILVGAFDNDGNFLMGGVGTFPSPDWDELNNGTGESKLYQRFDFLHNFNATPNASDSYTDPFVSTVFNFDKNRFIDMVIQGDFDRSVNIIFTDNKNPIRIINSRFKSTDKYGIYKLADRRGEKDSNIYSDRDWDRIGLVQLNDNPILIEGPKVENDGALKGGGYKYFFKYVTQEGNTTDVVEESPLIPISNGRLGLDASQISDKSISFKLSRLDDSYYGIQVYFAHFDGAPKASAKYYKIDYVYKIKAVQDPLLPTAILYESNIKHTGIEKVTPVDIQEINTSFTPIDTAKSIDIINDRLAIANVASTLKEEDFNTLEDISKKIYLWERSTTTTKSFADPETAALQLSLWKGEVYELGIVYLVKNKGLSPVFPIVGMDNIDGVQSAWGNSYPPYTVDDTGFDPNNHLINELGIFRTSLKGPIYTPTCEENGIRHLTYLYVDTSIIANDPAIKEIVTGFFIVRRERDKNVLLQGMTMPTTKFPGYRLTASPRTSDDGEARPDFIGSQRIMTKWYGKSYPTIGLNAKYKSVEKDSKDLFNPTFSEVFVPQPTQLTNVITHEKPWVVNGAVGQHIGDETFRNDVDKDGEELNEQHLAFYSPELDLNPENILNFLSGNSVSLEIQKMRNSISPTLQAEISIDTSSDPDYMYHVSAKYLTNGKYNFVGKVVEPIDYDRADFITIPQSSVYTTFIPSGTEITANGSFSGKIDRTFGLLSREKFDNNSVFPPNFVFSSRGTGTSDLTPIQPTVRYYSSDNGIAWTGGDFQPYSLISQSYSNYLGIKLDTENLSEIPEFVYKATPHWDKNNYSNNDLMISCTEGNSYSKYKYLYLNTGHLTSIFKSGSGRWTQQQLIDKYKVNTNKPYHAITYRQRTDVQSLNITRGDTFISNFFKRVTYKNGVGVLTATPGDAGTFGTGLNRSISNDFDEDKVSEPQKKDKGRNLYDVGYIVEMVVQSNINADIRSLERGDEKERQAVGYDKDFYPNKEDNFGDFRPDSSKYNDGYSPTNNVIPYFSVSESTLVLNTEFPNRVLVSESNRTQEFYNSFRDLKGFNFRDYGVELGQIEKIVAIKGVLLSVHTKGILAIGVDDRTLVAEGSNIFVDTAKSLSPKPMQISDLYGTTNPESIVKTDVTVIGVDFNSDIVWMFVGDKTVVISDFAVKTILKKFKKDIQEGGFLGDDDLTNYNPRVYSTYNSVKRTVYISYIAEHPVTKEQFHVGTLSYNTVLNKWMSRLSEGNKFLMNLKGTAYTFGFSEQQGIWKEDELIDPLDNDYSRVNVRGDQYTSEFEIVVNQYPTYEKILENLIVLCNKRIPAKLIFTTSGDVNDAALDIWGASAATKVVEQPIMVRGDSPRKSLRLGILDQNAYYRNSSLYIEVGKVKYSIKDAGNKRIRDKYIRIRFIYEGDDPLFIQAVTSILSISFN